jgi:hypothetical protein
LTPDTPTVFDPALQERQPSASRLLTAALTRRALSNAYLLTGRAVADKWLIARQLAAFLNCLNRKDQYYSCLVKAGEPASYCQNCRWISQGEHPQAWLVLEGEGKSGQIPVEKARLLTEEIAKTSHYMRVVVIPGSERDCLHAAPANALLKSIEEPHDNVLFLLFAASLEQVLQTIVSRSQLIPVHSRFSPGFWTPNTSAQPETSTPAQSRLNALASEFVQAAQRNLASRSESSSYLKAVSESQDLSEWLLSICADDEAPDTPAPESLLDLWLAAELEVLREAASRKPQVSLYLSKLAEQVEISKAQLDHYVKTKNVLETFAYCLTELRAKYLGEFSLAKN